MATVVMLPGMDGSGQLFDSIMSQMKPATLPRVVSYPPDRPLDYKRLEEVARSAIPGTGEFILIAESFSGPIAIAIAASRPTGLRGVVLVSTFVSCPIRVPKIMTALVTRVPVSLITSSVALRYVLGAAASPALIAQFKQSLTPVSAVAWRSRIQSVLEVDIANALARIDVPVLCLTALRDRIVPKSVAAGVACGAPDSHRVEIDGPHFLLQTRAAECSHAIRTWAREKRISI